jgi:quinoprotein glucose dehydrogenase
LGGNNWGSPALDPQRKLMVATTQHLPFKLQLLPRKDCPENLPFPQADSPYCAIMQPLTSPLGVPCTAPPWATLAALDLESGGIKWQIPFGTLEEIAPWPVYHWFEGGMQMGGPMVTASGLIFVGAASDGYFRAYSTDSGAELWRYKLPSTANSVPMSYRYQGKQYVVVATGGHFTSPMPAGDHVMAFSLGD